MSGLDGFSPRQYKAMVAILGNPSLKLAADEVGVTERTIRRWMADNRFKAELSQLEGEMLETVSRRLLSLSEQAVDVLEDLMEDANQSGGSLRLRTVHAILEQCGRFRELVITESRLAALEESVFNGER